MLTVDKQKCDEKGKDKGENKDVLALGCQCQFREEKYTCNTRGCDARDALRRECDAQSLHVSFNGLLLLYTKVLVQIELFLSRALASYYLSKFS